MTMPLLLESWILLIIAYCIGIGLGWLVWGRNAGKES